MGGSPYTHTGGEAMNTENLEELRRALIKGKIPAHLQPSVRNTGYLERVHWCRGADIGFRSRQGEVDDLKQSKDMGDQCLDMIRELLATELDMTHVPPYCYPEAIATVVGKRTQAMREQNDDLKGMIALLVASLKRFGSYDPDEIDKAAGDAMEYIAQAEAMIKGEKE
jgi:hypothetical protein